MRAALLLLTIRIIKRVILQSLHGQCLIIGTLGGLFRLKRTDGLTRSPYPLLTDAISPARFWAVVTNECRGILR